MDTNQLINSKKAQEVVVNGEVKGYYVSGKNELYIPVSALNNGSDVKMLSYMPGTGGSDVDARNIRNRIFNNPPDYVVSIAGEYLDRYKCIEAGYNAAKDLNINVTQNVTVCFSGSGYFGIKNTERFLENHPGVKTTVFSIEPSNNCTTQVYDFKSDTVSAMKENGTDVIFVTPEKFRINMYNQINDIGREGVNTYWLQTHYTGDYGSKHQTTNRDLQNSGIIDYVLGFAEDFDKNPGIDHSPNYQFYKYDKTTGQIVSANYDELAKAGVRVLQLPNIESLKKTDGFSITTTDSPALKKYSSLLNLENTEIKSKSGLQITSEYKYVSDTMNRLKTLIKNTSCLGGGGKGFKNMGFRSSSGIPGCIMGYINAYLDIVGSLMNSLSLEADAVISYGQAMVDMDEDMKKNAGNIGEVVEVDQNNKLINIGDLDKQADTTLPDTQTSTDLLTDTPIKNGLNNDNIQKNNSSYSNPGGYYPSGVNSSTSSNNTANKEEKVELKQADDKFLIQQGIKEVSPIKEKTTTSVIPQIVQKTVMDTPAQMTVPSTARMVEKTAEYIPLDNPQLIETNITIPTKIEQVVEEVKESIFPNTVDIIDNITKVPKITKIPTSSAPMPVISNTQNSGSSIIPVAAGLSVAGIAGIGAKAYFDQKYKKHEEEEYEFEEENTTEVDDSSEMDIINQPSNSKLQEDFYLMDQ